MSDPKVFEARRETDGAWVPLPQVIFEGANRYDTDTHHVLHLWVGGESYDLLETREFEGAALDRWPSPDDEVAVAELARHMAIEGFAVPSDDRNEQWQAPKREARAILTRLREAAK